MSRNHNFFHMFVADFIFRFLLVRRHRRPFLDVVFVYFLDVLYAHSVMSFSFYNLYKLSFAHFNYYIQNQEKYINWTTARTVLWMKLL